MASSSSSSFSSSSDVVITSSIISYDLLQAAPESDSINILEALPESDSNQQNDLVKSSMDTYEDDFDSSPEKKKKEDATMSKPTTGKSSTRKSTAKVSTLASSPSSLVTPMASVVQMQRSTVLEERRNEAEAAYEKWLKNKTAQQKAEKDKQKKEEDELRAVIKARDDAKREAQTSRLRRLESSTNERSGAHGPRGGRSLISRRGPLKPIRPSPYSESVHPGGGGVGGGGSMSAQEGVNHREEQIRNLQQQQEFLQHQLQMQMQILQQQGVAVPGFNLAIGLGTQALQQQQQQQQLQRFGSLLPNTPGGQFSMQRLQSIQSPNLDLPLGTWTGQIGASSSSNSNLPAGLFLQTGSSIKDRVASAGMVHADKMLASFNPNSASAAAASIDALSAHHNEKRRSSFSQKNLVPIEPTTSQRATTAPLGGHGHFKGSSGVVLDGDDDLLSFQDSSRGGVRSSKPKTASSASRLSPKLSQDRSGSSRGSPRSSRATIHSPASAGAVGQALSPRRPAEFLKKPEWDPYFKSTGAISGGLTFPDPSNAGSMSSIGTGSGKVFADPAGYSPKDAISASAGARLRDQRPQLSVQLDKPSLLENLAQATNATAASHIVSGKAFLANMSLPPPGLPPSSIGGGGLKQSSIISMTGPVTESSFSSMPPPASNQMDFGRVGSAPFNRPGMGSFGSLPILSGSLQPSTSLQTSGGPIFPPSQGGSSSSSAQFQSMISNFNIPGVPTAYTNFSSPSYPNNIGNPATGGAGLNSLLQRFDVAQFPSEETPTTRSLNASISPRRDSPTEMVERAMAVSQAVAQRALPPGASGLSKPFTYTPLASPLELASLEQASNGNASVIEPSPPPPPPSLPLPDVADKSEPAHVEAVPLPISDPAPANIVPEHIPVSSERDREVPPQSSDRSPARHFTEPKPVVVEHKPSVVVEHKQVIVVEHKPATKDENLINKEAIAQLSSTTTPTTAAITAPVVISVESKTEVKTSQEIKIVSQPVVPLGAEAPHAVETVKTEDKAAIAVDITPATPNRSEKKRGKSSKDSAKTLIEPPPTMAPPPPPSSSSSSSSSSQAPEPTPAPISAPVSVSAPAPAAIVPSDTTPGPTIIASPSVSTAGEQRHEQQNQQVVAPVATVETVASDPSPAHVVVPPPDDETVLETVFAIPVVPPPVLIEPRLPSSFPSQPPMPQPPDTDNDILVMHRDGLARFARAVAPAMIPNLETSWERFGGTMEGVVKLWDACERRYPSQTAPFTAEAIKATEARLKARDAWAAFDMEVQAYKLSEIEHHEWSVARMEKIQQRNLERCAAQAKLDGGPIEIPRHDAGVCVGAIFSSYVEPPSVLVDKDGKVLGPAEKDVDPLLLPEGVSVLAITSGIPPVPPIHEAMSRLRNLSTRDIRAIQYLRKATQALIITFGAMCVLLKLPTTWGAAMNALDDPELIDKLARLSTLACELHPRNDKDEEEGGPDETSRKDPITPAKAESGAITPSRSSTSPTPSGHSTHSPLKFAADAKDLKLSVQQVKLARKLLNKRPDVRAEVRTIAVTIKNIKRDDGMSSELNPNALERPFTVAADALVALLDWECSLVMTAIEQLKKQGVATQQQKLLQTLQVPSPEVLQARLEAEAEGRKPPVDEDEVSRLAAESTRIAAEAAAKKSKELVAEVERVEFEAKRLKEEEYNARVALESARLAAVDADRADKERKMARETEERARLVELALREQQQQQSDS